MKREAYFLDYAVAIQKVIDVPLMVTGGFRVRKTMQDALVNGELDVVGIARPLCAHPDLSRQLVNAEVEKAPVDHIRMGSGIFGPASTLNLFRVMNIQGEVAWHYKHIMLLAQDKRRKIKRGAYLSFILHQLREYRIGFKRKWKQRKIANEVV